ncbi:MAG: DnaD domain protein [Candidatus Improbicoccus pseudotrichonymphae]|uniref:DnaD domain protein n=1 Tax=Candidatus Improbicoccus pseudotrichonymphae TaxID=3033792 RepID=A0AA48HYS6_9FIRM|nr:MAG: DnaD domain protein [Candidatus Improbicoccus pseudotrichonymphae]
MQCILKCDPEEVISNIKINDLKLSDSVLQLKIIILISKKYLIKIDSVFIAETLNENIESVESAILFWAKNGLFEIIYNREVICQRKNRKSSIYNSTAEDNSLFLREAENILKRQLSSADVSTFLDLKNKEHLSDSVIIMLIQYCAGLNRTNCRYIYSVGVDWAKDGINSIEKVEKKIKEIDKFGRLWRKYESIIGFEKRSPTAKEKEAVVLWFETWKYPPEIIKEAYDICVNSKGKYIFNYINKIIENWHNNKVSSLEDIAKLRIQYKSNQKSKGVSYDIKKFEEREFSVV